MNAVLDSDPHGIAINPEVVPFLDEGANEYAFNGNGINIMLANAKHEPRMNIGFKGTGYIGDILGFSMKHPPEDEGPVPSISIPKTKLKFPSPFGDAKDPLGRPALKGHDGSRPIWYGPFQKQPYAEELPESSSAGFQLFGNKLPKTMLRISVWPQGVFYKNDVPSVMFKIVPPKPKPHLIDEPPAPVPPTGVYLNSPDVPVYFAAAEHSFL